MLNSQLSFAQNIDVNSGSVENKILPDDAKTLNVFDTATAINTTVNSEGTLNINSGGTADGVIVNSGGKMNMETNSVGNNITVNDGGNLNVGSLGATIYGLTINDGGTFVISTDSTISDAEFYGLLGSIASKEANAITLKDDSQLIVNDGGSAIGTIVDEYGQLVVKEGGAAINTTVKEDGVIIATEKNAFINTVVIQDGGTFELSTDASVIEMYDDNEVSLGSIQNNKAQNVTVNDDSVLTVKINSDTATAGSADGTKVNGGTLEVYGNGVIVTNTSITNDGELIIENEASATTVNVNGEGNIEVNSGSVSGATLTGSEEFEKATIDVGTNATASNTILNNYSEMTVSGEADTTTVNSGGVLVVDGGKVTLTTVNNGGLITNNSAKGTIEGLTISSGGSFDLSTDVDVSTSTINGNNMGTIASGVATNFVINNDSNLTISSGHSANNTTVEDGGTITATEKNATVNGVSLKEGAQFNFSTDATVSNLKDGAGNGIGGTITDSVASGFQVTESSVLTATTGGTIDNSSTYKGKFVVEDGGTIKNSTVGNDGTIIAHAGSTVSGVVIDALTGGSFDFSTGALVENTKYNDKNINIAGNKASGIEVGTGSKLTATEGGQTEDIVVNGGAFNVNANASASDTEVKNGTMNILGGSTSNTTISGGVINASGGANMVENVVTGGILNLGENVNANSSEIKGSGVVNVNQYGLLSSSTVSSGGAVYINSDGQTNDLNIADGGVVTARADGKINTVTVTKNGNLVSEANAKISNLTANADAKLNLATGTILTDTLVLDVDADASGSSLDFSNIFNDTDNSPAAVILKNGVNEAFKGKLIDATGSKSLTLDGGTYTVSDSGLTDVFQIDGWNIINLDNGTMRLESDITMSGTDKNLSIAENTILDVSGTLDNVLKVTLDGNIINNGTIDITKQSIQAGDEFTIMGNYTAESGAQLVMNINPKDSMSDKIIINGDVSGTTTVYLTSSSPRVPNGNILLVDAPNDNADTSAEFNIWRVEGSPFTWETLFENNKWYGYVTDGDRPGIVPETIAYYGLIDNTFMQTASLGATLRSNIAENEFRKTLCQTPNKLKYVNRICRSSRPVFTGWAAPVYSSVTVETPYNYTASITGVDGGLDLISDGYAKFGLLASYRSGLYKYEKDGEHYTIKGEAETTINSYLGGAYIRYDRGSWSVLAAAYAGMLDADISTKDGVNSSTSGTTYGATLDVSYIYKNINGLRIEPGVRISYASVELDEIEDNAGKAQEFEGANRQEIEAGIRLAKRWEFPEAKAEIYAKPSIVQTINSGSMFELIEERELESTEDRTLFKVEAGVLFDMIANWSASIEASYSFGSDFTNATAGMSLRYAL